ncbi:TetR family transcriptional regulator C-terminal domain-containing protein [Rhizobium sp. TH2]|uniref:TetR family transcriptional regulator C-terminal domain-containing protein n=1 Tax=Rhizobium sp. TH2 TaxID=2775403 RepID=UPI00215866FA|nr:TetR family transcriptional regulator C-terminal domain-containing protein [Rhizobium sp. TH2]UVC10549.1 TetR family transcriptional regulator C-terminal domain-containing protein [Rhizobium sp. TH2]
MLERRDDLIQGTIRSIASIGYNDSTINTICEAAGFSRGLIGYYFKSKDELLIEAYRYLVAQADAEARQAVREAGPDPLQRLLAAIAQNFRRMRLNQEDTLVTWACLGVAPWNAGMLDLTHTLWRKYRSWIERMIAEAAAQRNLEIDARKAAITYVQLADGLWVGWLLDKEAYSLEEAEEIARDWILELLGEKQTKPAPARKPAPSRKKATSKVTGRKSTGGGLDGQG